MSFSSYTVVVTCSLELRQDDGKEQTKTFPYLIKAILRDSFGYRPPGYKLLQETLNINWHPYVLIQPTGQEVRNRLNATTGQTKR